MRSDFIAQVGMGVVAMKPVPSDIEGVDWVVSQELHFDGGFAEKGV